MSRILHIISSPKGRNSVTLRLGNALIERLKAKAPDKVLVNELNLSTTPFPHLTAFHLAAFHTPAAQRTPAQAAAAYRSEAAIAQLVEADTIVIGAPMHNYSIPSVLKAYLDHVVRAGMTFGFSAQGREGLFKHKKAYIAFAAGWDFSDPALQPYDFCVPYLTAVLALIGITDSQAFRVEGALGPQAKEVALAQAIAGLTL